MNKDTREIFDKVIALSGVKPGKSETPEQAVLRGLKIIEERMEKVQEERDDNINRVNNMLDVVMAMAKLDYTQKANLSEKRDYLDGLAAGINMLGEELQVSTVSLYEKEVLLKEIHHRVKNNLQIISSLLNLQADQIDDPGFKEMYRASRDRIRSMALVHEKLYESKDLSLVDFSDYIFSLAKSLNFSYNPDNEKIRVQFDIDEETGFFPIETAVPAGLILNELLSNCFKYAFPEKKDGNISITFGKVKQEKGRPEYQLAVKDDGVGLPEEINIETAETLGFQLIAILAQQLDGTVKVNRGKGTEVKVVFRVGK